MYIFPRVDDVTHSLPHLVAGIIDKGDVVEKFGVNKRQNSGNYNYNYRVLTSVNSLHTCTQ